MTHSLGASVQGRPINAVEIGATDAPRKILIVGCIHGDETAGIAIARLLERSDPRGADIWVVESLNPDGQAAHTRQNADRVDLNRNFPSGWQPIGKPGSQQYSGPSALSEPESRIAYDLISKLRPSITIWYHQPEAVVDESGGDPAIERRYASAVGLPFRRLTRYPGSAATWQNVTITGSTAVVVELPRGTLSAVDVKRHVAAVLALAGA